MLFDKRRMLSGIQNSGRKSDVSNDRAGSHGWYRPTHRNSAPGFPIRSAMIYGRNGVTLAISYPTT